LSIFIFKFDIKTPKMALLFSLDGYYMSRKQKEEQKNGFTGLSHASSWRILDGACSQRASGFGS
jgi:hypothetical protein